MASFKRDKATILKNAISPYEEYCDGYGNLGSSGTGYLLGTVISVGKAKKQFSHSGSSMLDQINAFDKAEVNGPYIGQINMSTVSSFCGINGLIWGYDVCKVPKITQKSNYLMECSFKHYKLPVYSLDPLVDATESLFGRVGNLNYPLIPGAHVPCATKSIKVKGPGRVYSALAIGIPRERGKSACLLMEDIGILKEVQDENVEAYESIIIENLAKSVIQIGINQHVKFEKILAGVRSVFASEGEFACGLVAAPYFTIAKNAVVNNMSNISINDWVKRTSGEN